MGDESEYYFNANKFAQETGENVFIETGLTSPAQDPKAKKPSAPKYTQAAYHDASDDLANLKHSLIGFQHVASGDDTYFKAFITRYDESFACDWSPEHVFGRNDPIYQFKSTTRTITVGWKIPASTISEALENIQKVQRFLRYLYPNYETGGNALTISASPLVRMKLMNLASNTSLKSTVSVNAPKKISFTKDAGRGLLGVIKNVAVDHHLDGQIGVFHGDGAAIPKLIELTIDFGVLHEEALGWNTDDEFGWVNTGNHGPCPADKSVWPYSMPAKDTGKPFMGTDASSIQKKVNNQMNLVTNALNEQIEQEFEQELREADFLNAEARYGGMFGRMMAKRDAKKFADETKRAKMTEAEKSAARGASSYFEARGHERGFGSDAAAAEATAGSSVNYNTGD